MDSSQELTDLLHQSGIPPGALLVFEAPFTRAADWEGGFEALFNSGTGKVLGIEVSRSNPNVI